MFCQLCGKKIGPFRRFVDKEFCSAAHRHEARSVLDRTLADIDDAVDERWTVERARRASARTGSPSAYTASVLLLVVAAVLVLATVSFSGGATQSFAASVPSARPSENSSPTWTSRFNDTLGRAVRSRTPATLHEDFHSGISEWVRSMHNDASAPEWTFSADGLKPGRLRIWKRSTELANYELDFLGQIDRKGMGWAYRALDANNYYATKLTIVRSGPGPNAGLIRYVMLNGREMDRAQFPIPLTLTPGEPYKVRVSVKADHFITSVDGQVVSSWSDQRLHRGGVGFFTDEGESATVRWVSLSERDSLLGRVLSYFSLIQMPWIDVADE